MMKIWIALVISWAATLAGAQTYDDSPTRIHNLEKVRDTTLAVTIKFAKNVQATCDKESRKRGNKGFSYQLVSCAFWTDDTCTIVFPKRVSLHTIGHEFLHCLQGDWHPQ